MAPSKLWRDLLPSNTSKKQVHYYQPLPITRHEQTKFSRKTRFCDKVQLMQVKHRYVHDKF